MSPKNAPNPEIIEFTMENRCYKITLDARFNAEARREIRETFHKKEIHFLDLLRTHVNKIQEISTLRWRLENLLKKFP